MIRTGPEWRMIFEPLEKEFPGTSAKIVFVITILT